MPPEGAGDSQQARDRVLAEVLWKTREAVVASKGPNSLAAAPSPEPSHETTCSISLSPMIRRLIHTFCKEATALENPN